jgi:crotonobetainyl-CoA:carnitine CoA-transferase CaiB-like acyl-CoA transferase
LNSQIVPRGPAPELGAHTREALADHGFTADEIRALDAEGVFG